MDEPEISPETGLPQLGMYDEGLWPEYANPSYVMPPVIEVKMGAGTAGEYYFPVAISKFDSKKPYLGGFRNKKSAQIYHHAGTQTPTEVKKAKDMSHLRTRDTQTYEIRSVSNATVRESGTQMERVDLSVDTKRDRVLMPRSYFTSDQLLAQKKIMSVEIQRYWRGYMARCRAIEKRNFIDEWEQKQDDETLRALEELRTTKALHLERRRNPQSNADFAGLYNELDTWRIDQVKKVKLDTEKGDLRRSKMVEVLYEETKALQAIQKLKVAAIKANTERKTSQMLEHMAQPQRWQMSDGNIAAVQTPETIRAARLYEHYKALTDEDFTVDSRLNTLLAIKWCVKDHPCALTRELSDLLDREADLLGRGRTFKSMAGLRKRIKSLFLQFIEDPQFNPRAADFIDALPAPPKFPV